MKQQYIFYGPPGVGKTFCLKEEVLKVLDNHNRSKDDVIQTLDKGIVSKSFSAFYTDNSYLLKDADYKPGKKAYRNMRSINKLMQLFVNEDRDSLSKEEIQNKMGWYGPSTYVQHERILTNFNFVKEDWKEKNRDRLTLNDKGISLRDKYKEYDSSNNGEGGLPGFAIEAIKESLIHTKRDSMSLWKNTILTMLWLGIEKGYVFKYRGQTTPTEDEKELLMKCCGYASTDVTFLEWAITYLTDLKLVNEDNEKDDRIIKYYLNDDAFELISKLEILNNTNDIVLETQDMVAVGEEKAYRLKNEFKQKREYLNTKYNFFKETRHQVEFITMHASFEYEDFIEGISVKCGNENLRYYYKTGILKHFCNQALKNVIIKNLKNQNWIEENLEDCIKKLDTWDECFEYYKKHRKQVDWDLADQYILIIDEINRGDITKIFGEVMTILEDEKRIGGRDEIVVKLPYTQQEFGIPKNVLMLCTMNTADRSIGSMDLALRRRFNFIPVKPNLDIVNDIYEVTPMTVSDEQNILLLSSRAIQYINSRIRKVPYVGNDKLIGHSYLILGEVVHDDDILKAWRYDIFPYLEELFYEQFGELIALLEYETILDEQEGFNDIKDEELIEFIKSLANRYEE